MKELVLWRFGAPGCGGPNKVQRKLSKMSYLIINANFLIMRKLALIMKYDILDNFMGLFGGHHSRALRTFKAQALSSLINST
jgi:hypothetical protein